MKRILILVIIVANLSISQKIIASEGTLHANQDTLEARLTSSSYFNFNKLEPWNTDPPVREGNSAYSVQINTTVQDDPPAIEFSWDEIPGSQYVRIYKRPVNTTEWGQPIATISGNVSHYTDLNVAPGVVYEYGFFKTPSWITDTVVVEPGSQLTFEIFDSWGDGICCDLGFGYYRVMANDSLFASGGSFSFSESSTIIIPDHFPSHTMLIVDIYFDSLPEETTWSLTDNNTSEELLSGGPYETHKFTYILAGLEKPLVEQRGTILLVIDEVIAPVLNSEMNRYKKDLIGDGWKVRQISVNIGDSVPGIKAQIVNECNEDTSIVSLVLIGHIPVPYSGNISMDGHPDHKGAWPADAYYGDLDGSWTDSYIDNISATRPENHNVPGDGKFDQSFLPSDVDLQIGRIDLYNLPAFPESETDLLKRYFDKNYNFRHGLVAVESRGLIDENLSSSRHAVGWRNFAAMLGASSISALEYLPTLETESYLWSFGCAGSGYTQCGGVASTDDFATKQIQTVFTMLFGSYFGDWDNENNVLRSPLASNGMILANMWACVPHWYLHPMGLGETIGFCSRLSQNNATEYSSSWGNRSVHTALMGDPSLRMHIVKPVSVLNIVETNGPEVSLSWESPMDSVLGYNIYRSDNIYGDFERINEQTVIESHYTDQSPITGNNVYMVRAIKLELCAGGTYYNMSQGIIDSVLIINSGITGLSDENMGININPNPVKNMATISYFINDENHVSLIIIDTQGKKIKSLADEWQEAGIHKYMIDASGLSNGIYYCQVIAGRQIRTTKMIIAK